MLPNPLGKQDFDGNPNDEFPACLASANPLFSAADISFIHFEESRADDLFLDAPRAVHSLCNMVHAVW